MAAVLYIRCVFEMQIRKGEGCWVRVFSIYKQPALVRSMWSPCHRQGTMVAAPDDIYVIVLTLQPKHLTRYWNVANYVYDMCGTLK